MITIRCGACNGELTISSVHEGRKVPCPSCGGVMVVPDAARPGGKGKTSAGTAEPARARPPEPPAREQARATDVPAPAPAGTDKRTGKHVREPRSHEEQVPLASAAPEYDEGPPGGYGVRVDPDEEPTPEPRRERDETPRRPRRRRRTRNDVDWSKVSTGVGLILYGEGLGVLWTLVDFIARVLLRIAAPQDANAGASRDSLSAALDSDPCSFGLGALGVGTYGLLIMGLAFSLFVTSRHGARALAIVTLGLMIIAFLLTVPDLGRVGGGRGLGGLVFSLAHVPLLFFLRAVALVRDDRGLARAFLQFLIVMIVLVVGSCFVLVGYVIWALSNTSREDRAAAPPGEISFASVAMVLAGLLVSLACQFWLLGLIAQARNILPTTRGRELVDAD